MLTTSRLNKYLMVDQAVVPKAIPNRNTFTFLSKKSGIQQVWRFDGDTGAIEQFSNLPDRIRSVYHSPSGNSTIVGMDEKGNEKQQLYLLENNGKEVEELVVSSKHFHRFGGWSPDETKIVFSSNRRHQGYFDVFLLDLITKETELLYQYDGNCTPLCWTKDGESIIVSIQNTNIDNSLYVINIRTKNSQKIGSADTLARYQFMDVVTDSYRPPELKNNQKGGFVLSDIGRDYLAVYEFSLSNPSDLSLVMADENWDIEEIKLSPDEKHLAYSINEGGTSRLGIYHLESGSYEKIDALPNGVVESISWINNNEFIFGLKSATMPGDVWKATSPALTVERVTFFGASEGISEQWLEPKLYHFTSFDGLKIPYFYYGKMDDSLPVVVYVHGGPEHQTRNEYNPVIQYLAAEGFIVVAPNVRGSMGYGREYVSLDNGRKRLDAVADLAWLVKDLETNHFIDPKKVGIMGRSYGGFMVLASLTHYPDVWAAGVDIVGISHFKTFLENTGPWRRKLREFEYGSLEKDSDFFEEIAPLNLTDRISAPLLIFHGRNDTRVPVSEAIQLAMDLKGREKQVELVIFEDEGHQTEKLENHIEMNTRIVQFMQKVLS